VAFIHHVNGDVATGRGVVDTVLYQIGHHLAQPVGIASDGHRVETAGRDVVL
jgi:hypothetical protein